MAIIACQRVARRYDRKNALCCGDVFAFRGLTDRAKEGISKNPGYPGANLCLAAAHNLLGREEEAHAAAEKYLKLRPRFSLDQLKKRYRKMWNNKADFDWFITTLRKAGLK